MFGDVGADDGLPAGLVDVLESAARLQRVVPDAVLVGGSAAAWYAHHRTSFDHDHVVPDLTERYQMVLEAVEATDGWATAVRSSRPPYTLLGSLGGIEAGLRQLRRRRPLEVTEVTLPSGGLVRVPTAAETLRIKAYLVVQRNQVRDYLDVAALADAEGLPESARVVRAIDEYYDDRSEDEDSVATAVVARLARPAPRDARVLRDLPRYKELRHRWQDWQHVCAVCQALAVQIVTPDEAD